MKLIQTSIQKEEYYEIQYYDITVDGSRVGECQIITDDDYTYLERIDIDEAHQSKGYGTRVIGELKDMLDVSELIAAPDNADCQRWMERIGEENNDGLPVDQGFGVYEI